MSDWALWQEQKLPAPDGRGCSDNCAWWQQSDGSPIHACSGRVYRPFKESIDAVERDAYAALAACAWARSCQSSEGSGSR